MKLDNIVVSDAELVLFCLSNNPLNRSPYFRQKLLYLKYLLQQELKQRPRYNEDSVFQFDLSYTNLDEMEYENLAKFLYAIHHKNKVHLFEKGTLSKSEAIIPKGIFFKDNSAMLIFYDEQSRSENGFDVSRLQGISLSNLKFRDRPKLVLESAVL